MHQKIKIKFIGIVLTSVFLTQASFVYATSRDVLNKEEDLWLKSRNNTIVVYPERNYPPFSYQSPGGNIQGLSVDYLELIAEKLGIKISYLSPQSKNQIIKELASGKGDVTTGFAEISKANDNFIFTESYITVPTVIIVRKDVALKKDFNLTDFNGRRVSVVAGSALYTYVHENYPRVILEDTTDNEVILQQIVLGEVDAGIMDVASLSYFLSKQVLSSVKVAGGTGFDYKLSFMLPENKAILQSILEKGLMQISIKEREMFNEKWIVMPEERKTNDSLLANFQTYFDEYSIYTAFVVLILIIFILIIRQSRYRTRFFRKAHSMHALKEDIQELEEANQMIVEELKEVQENEALLHQRLKEASKHEI